MPMMVLGLFVFSLRTVPYQNFQQEINWRHPSQNRVGRRPASQFLGIGEEKVTLSGRLAPEITGGRVQLELISIMADQGKAWPLIGGDGWFYGLHVIESLSRDYSEFFADGRPRLIDFSLSLKRTDDSTLDLLGEITDAMIGLL